MPTRRQGMSFTMAMMVGYGSVMIGWAGPFQGLALFVGAGLLTWVFYPYVFARKSGTPPSRGR